MVVDHEKYNGMNCFLWCALHGFVCTPTRNKRALLKWSTSEGRLKDPEEMSEWVNRYHPECGILTEVSCLVVIDCDVAKETGEPIGRDNLIKLLGNDPESETFAVRSPSGGMHYYFRCNEVSTFTGTVSKLGPGIDVRAKGNLIIAPYSITERGQYLPVNDLEIAPLPEKVAALIRNAQSAARPKQKTQSHSCAWIEPDRYSPRADAKIKKQLNRLDGIHEGKRNNLLFKVACQVYKYKRYYSRLELTEMLRWKAQAIGLPDKEIEPTLLSAWNRVIHEEIILR